MLQIDHIGVTARDPKASAEALAHLLGTGAPTTDGADDDMFRVDLEDGAFLLFSAAETISVSHIAFHVEPERFAEVVDRIRARKIPFGNDPEDTKNGKTDDPLGGAGRVYFVSDDGHLFEVTC